MVAKIFYRLTLVISLSFSSLSANADYTFNLLDMLGGTSSYAYGINDSGQIVGSITGANGTTSATLWSNGTTAYLDSLGGSYNTAIGINASGQIISGNYINGTSADNGAYRATIWNGGTITELGTLGGTGSVANSINASGDVVGFSSNSGNLANLATLWSNGNVIDLNSFLPQSIKEAGWILYSANAINDSGTIVGAASNSLLGISSQAFILAAVPEPKTNLMLLMGLGLLGFMARSRKAT